MREHNKRIVIFIEDRGNKMPPDASQTMLVFPAWEYMVESLYGTLDPQEVCNERPESFVNRHKNRKLFMLNYFGTITGTPATFIYNTAGFLTDIAQMRPSAYNNSCEQLKKVIALCKSRGLADCKAPNFISLDFVDEGDAMHLINEINDQGLLV
jgi:hypothetical protein